MKTDPSDCPHEQTFRTQGDVTGTPMSFCEKCRQCVEIGFGPVWERSKPEFDWDAGKHERNP